MALMLLYDLMGFLPERSLCDKKEKKTYGKSKGQRFPKQLLLALTSCVLKYTTYVTPEFYKVLYLITF